MRAGAGAGDGWACRADCEDQDGLRASSDADRVLEHVARENPGAAAHEDHISRAVERQHAADAQRRLGVAVRDDGVTPTPLEHELETRGAAHCRRRARIGKWVIG